MNQLPFTSAETFAQSIINLNCYIALTMVYLKEKGESVENWLHFIGNKFIKTWPELLENNLEEMAWGVALNNLSGGATLVSFLGNDSEFEIIVEGWPPQEILDVSELSWEESQLIHEVLRPVFEQNGLDYSWQIEGKQVRIQLSRRT